MLVSARKHREVGRQDTRPSVVEASHWRKRIERRSIVVGLDGSDNCGRGLQWAIDHVHDSGAEVLAVHVVDQPVPSGWPPEAARELLETVREQASESLEEWTVPLRSAGINHRCVVLEGSPAEALLEFAAQEDAGAIVIGRRGLGGFARLLLGSVSYSVIQESVVPVIVIPPA